MKSVTIKTLTCVCAIGTLAACGGSSTRPDGPTQFEGLDPGDLTNAQLLALTAQAERYEAILARNAGADATPVAEMPGSGTADFSGVVAIIERPQNVRTSLLGDAEIAVDFGANTVTGTMDNFFGADGETLDVYTGTLSVGPGAVGNITANDVTVLYGGTLQGNDDTLELDGQLFGNFIKSPLGGLKLDTPISETMQVNGTEQNVRVGIVAEIVP